MNPTAYQRVRLWAGITSIGANLGAIWLVALTAPGWITLLPPGVPIVVPLAAIALIWPIANLPFEILIGHAAESAFDRTTQSLRSWLSDWIRSSAVTALGLFIAFGGFYLHASSASTLTLPLLILSVIGITIGLLRLPDGAAAPPESCEAAFETTLSRELGIIGQPPRQIRWFENADTTSVNGYIRPLPPRNLCLATNVARNLTAREAALLAGREEWFVRSRASWLTTIFAALWLLAGVALALRTDSTPPMQAAFLGPAIVTSWCFLALFVWPTLNRFLNTRADRSLAAVASADEITALINRLQELNATDPQLTRGKTAIFHPIASATDRASIFQ